MWRKREEGGTIAIVTRKSPELYGTLWGSAKSARERKKPHNQLPSCEAFLNAEY